MNKTATAVLIGIIGAIGFLLIVWFYRGNQVETAVNARWEGRLFRANHTIDSLQSVPAKVDTFVFRVRIKSAPVDYQTRVDSAFDAGFRHGTDSLRKLFTWVAQPFDTSHVFLSGDTILAGYQPLVHTGFLSEHPKAAFILRDSIFVPLPMPPLVEPWYRIPGWIAVGVAAGIIIKTLWVR